MYNLPTPGFCFCCFSLAKEIKKKGGFVFFPKREKEDLSGYDDAFLLFSSLHFSRCELLFKIRWLKLGRKRKWNQRDDPGDTLLLVCTIDNQLVNFIQLV